MEYESSEVKEVLLFRSRYPGLNTPLKKQIIHSLRSSHTHTVYFDYSHTSFLMFYSFRTAPHPLPLPTSLCFCCPSLLPTHEEARCPHAHKCYPLQHGPASRGHTTAQNRAVFVLGDSFPLAFFLVNSSSLSKSGAL